MIVRFASLLLLASCGTATVQFFPDLWTWDDTGLPDPQGFLGIDFERVTLTCDAAEGGLSMQLYTFGPAGGGTLWIGDGTDVWEAHELLLVEASPDGAWDRYRVGPLLDGSDVATPGQRTRFACDGPEPIILAQIRDRFGNPADCVRSSSDGTLQTVPSGLQQSLFDCAWFWFEWNSTTTTY